MKELGWIGLALAASLAVMSGCGNEVLTFGPPGTTTSGEGGTAGTGGSSSGTGGSSSGTGGSSSGTGGSSSGTGGTTSSGTGGTGGTPCSTGMPAGPVPADGAADVDFATVTGLDWDDAAGATGYDVYFSDSCPPPSYPDPAFQSVTASELTGLALAAETDYCWQVVALGADCSSVGPVWTFQTACDDPVAGPPQITSASLAYPPGTTAGSYTLTFSEDVVGVNATSVTWTAVTGSGTMDALTAVDPATYAIDFSGVAGGDEYTLSVPATVADICGNPLAAQDITITIMESGQTCAEAVDVTNAAFPLQLPGDFTNDAPGGSCHPNAANIVWYEFTPPTTQDYTIWLHNNATNPWSYVSIFETTACNPYGTEVLCQTAQAPSIEVTVTLTGGTTYLIMYHEEANQYPMTDPTISISYPGPGDECTTPIDITGATFPHTEVGTFSFESDAPPPCDANATVANMVFFEYTPPASGLYSIEGFSADASATQTRLAVYETTACNPYGTTLACVAVDSPSAQAIVDLQQGTTYLIQLTTNLDNQLMVDPTIDIQPFAFAAGESCADAIDISSATFPHTEVGTFSYEVDDPPPCDANATVANMVFFQYTPAASGWYTIDASSASASATQTRLAIYETTACNPYGTSLGCELSNSSSAQTVVNLQQGMTYLIQFTTNLDNQLMVDPTISIQPAVPGWSCQNPATTAAPNHTIDANGHHCWSWAQDTTDNVSDNSFLPCDGQTGGDVVIAFTTGNTQTTLSYDVALTNTQNGNGYVVVEVLAGSCTTGASQYCFGPGAGGPQAYADQLTGLTPATTYYVWVADGWNGNFLPDVTVCLW